MSSMLAPGVRETTSTAGTGTVTLVAVTGSVAFSEAFANGVRVCYGIKNGNNWEWGIGTVGAAKTLDRTIPMVTYVGGVFDNAAPSAISLAGDSEVFCTAANNMWMFGPAGIVTHTVLGSGAGSASATGSNDTAVGQYSQYSLTTGSNDTAVGQDSQRSLTTGSYDTAVGVRSQYSLTTGSNDTAVGAYSQRNLTIGDGDTAVGQYSQYSLTTGSYDTAVGQGSQYSLTTGSYDTAVGQYSQYSLTTGSYDTAVGQGSQYSLTTGSNDTAVGQGSQYSLTTGSYDTAVGQGSQKNLTTGSGNITIGGTSAAGVYSPVFDVTTQDNIISIGSTAVTAAYVNVAWTVVSDERDKTNIKSLPHGLDVVNALSPVQYERRTARDEGGDGIARYGFIAQNVLAVPGAEPVVDARNKDRLGLHSDYIVPLLVRAVQELSARVATLEGTRNG